MVAENPLCGETLVTPTTATTVFKDYTEMALYFAYPKPLLDDTAILNVPTAIVKEIDIEHTFRAL